MLQVDHTYSVIINSGRLMLSGETAGVYCKGHTQNTDRTTLNIVVVVWLPLGCGRLSMSVIYPAATNFTSMPEI